MHAFRQISCASPRARRLLVVLAAAAAGSVAMLAAGWGGSATASPRAVSPTVQGGALVQRFFTLLHNSDTSGLKALLAPSFQVVRANGGVQNKASYLSDPPQVARFTIAKLRGTRHGDVLVASYQVTVTETIGGVEQPATRAPRLSVFQLESGSWHLVAHANFGAIST
jgi:uncharacterized protein DUF4440